METLGQWGESFAVAELIRRGWTILERNFSTPFGELDIIARDTAGVLVFVEVKTMNRLSGGLMPEDNLSEAKLAKLKKTAEFYANRNPQLVHKNGWRLDLCAISVLTDINKSCELKIYANIAGGDS